MVKSSEHTIHWEYARQLRDIGVEFKPLANTTLNEKLNHYPDIQPNNGEYPIINYFAIGTGGTKRIDSDNNYRYSEHSSIDGSLFNMVPFLLKTKDNDISKEEQKRYRFRKVIDVEGVEYIAYYLKMIETRKHTDFYYEIISNDNHSLAKYNNNNEDILNPKPLDKAIHINNLETKYITALYKLYFTLSKNEITELMNVLSILKLDIRHITEIGVCSGIERDIITNDVISMVATNVQLAYFLDVDLILTLDLINNEAKELIDLYIEIGGSEPNVSA